VTDSLAVWLYGTLVAALDRNQRRRLTLRYTQEAFDRFGPYSPIFSASMPLRREPYPNAITRDFFDGLLPEGEARRTIARELGIDEEDTYSLICELGRDCAGALVVQAGSEPVPPEISLEGARPISDAEVAERIASLPLTPLGVDEEIRLSLAGVQRKLLLTRRADGGWALPINGVPSTHILKPQIDNPDWPGTVENEAFCMRLARVSGLRAAEVEVLHFGHQPVLVVERFDRRISNGRVSRIHQEDSCQALGLRPTQKYEDRGGPSFKKVADVLKRFRRESDLPDLLALVTFNIAIGNADGHGKNYSILHHPGGSLELSPGYDLMSTVMYPEVSRTMGMYVDSVRRIDQVKGQRIVNEAASWGIRRDLAKQIVANTLHNVGVAIDNMDSGLEAPPGLSDAVKRRTAELVETLHPRVEVEAFDSKKTA